MTPIWKPMVERQRGANLTEFVLSDPRTLVYAESFDYAGLHQWSEENREEFWSRLWDYCGIIGDKGSRIVENGDKMPGAGWFPDATLNFAENLLRDRPEDSVAIVCWNESGRAQGIPFRELKRSVASIASYFKACGVGRGDRIAGYTHNGSGAVIAMLAAASIGALWSSCSSDFGPRGVLDRLGQIQPRILIVSDGYYYKGQKIGRLNNARDVARKLPSLERVVVIPYVDSSPSLEGFISARFWPEVITEHANAALQFEPLPFNHPLYILFTSGTTGAPKCIMHGAGGTLLQHLKEHQLQCDVKAGDKVFYATTTGWMMWNWLVSALASNATILLYDGFPMARDGRILFDLAQEERTSLLGVSAGYLKTAEKLGLKPRETHDLVALRLVTSTGSPLSPESFDYVYRDVKRDVQLASISGGSDIISCFVGGNPWGPVFRGEIQSAGLGMAVEVWNESGHRVIGEQGELVCTRSFPSMPIYFWNDFDGSKYRDAYFDRYPGVWRHGDYATQTGNGGFIIHGRSDATLNSQGVRIGTADIYSVVEGMPEVEEALAVDQELEGGTRIVLFVKLRPGLRLDEVLTRRIKHNLRDQASPRHAPAVILEASDFPHTRSGKPVELAVREIIHGRPVKNIESLSNPESLEFFSNLPSLKASNDGRAGAP